MVATFPIPDRHFSGGSNVISRFQADSLQDIVNTLRTETVLTSFTNATRPDPTSVPIGFMIFNTDDNFPNVSDGTDWRDMAGATT